MAKKPTKKKGVARTPPFEAYPEWSSAKFFSFLRSAIRSRQLRWPPRNLKKMEGRRIYIGDNPRQKYEYHCEVCDGWFPEKMIEMDHIIPVGSIRSFQEFGEAAERMFCHKDLWRRVCKDCHKKITSQQREDKKKEKE